MLFLNLTDTLIGGHIIQFTNKYFFHRQKSGQSLRNKILSNADIQKKRTLWLVDNIFMHRLVWAFLFSSYEQTIQKKKKNSYHRVEKR